MRVEQIYYIGELLFRPACRNCGLGMQAMERVVERVRSLGYRYLACVTVSRPDDHPRRPADYLPIERFLARNDFHALTGATTSFTWLETDGVRRSHTMKVWLKALPG